MIPISGSNIVHTFGESDSTGKEPVLAIIILHTDKVQDNKFQHSSCESKSCVRTAELEM